jgi:hypothetical protein
VFLHRATSKIEGNRFGEEFLIQVTAKSFSSQEKSGFTRLHLLIKTATTFSLVTETGCAAKSARPSPFPKGANTKIKMAFWSRFLQLSAVSEEVIGAKARFDPGKWQKQRFAPAYFVNLVY